ncbi:hypothetical protein ACQUW5_04490 [Legionella sp. CNM-1927-20]|uniref:hypothetical protein n=1 Tax=Legionella sp. CNM-1927-20 TaxID=3422221 RepID=UPI00403A9931
MVDKVWVYQGTGIIYPNTVDTNLLTDTKLAKNGMVVAGKLTDASQQVIALEYIMKDTQRQRANRIWVYEQTGFTYDIPFKVSDLTDTKLENGLVVRGKLTDASQQVITLEYITKSTQRERARIWVYQGTEIIYPNTVDTNLLTDTKLAKNGMVVAGKLTDASQQVIALECITKCRAA